MNHAETLPDLERTLHERFDLDHFRPGQREVIQEVLSGRDVLCVMPTGGGKSLCYQLPALLLPGVTLVVSPLIALMKDQVDALLARGIRATLINSTLDLAEQNARIAEVEMRRYDLVYVAPERFRSGRFVETMNRVKPSLLAIDEAHCISEWGHDFRPDYARLGAARRALGMPPCIALTATATDLVRRDISAQLDLINPAQYVTGFDRPNLTYRVHDARKDQEKLAIMAEVLQRNPGPSIVYASSRKRCEEVGGHLRGILKRDAVIYHAGLTRDERTFAQDRFMKGEADVVVATNAFGMGVDKSNIRSVIHFNMPGTLEAYYQEAGRAGRDGLPSECVLLHSPGDRYLQEMFIENEYPPADAILGVYDFLRTLDAEPIELTQEEIRESCRVEIQETAVGTALRILESATVLERLRPRENMAIIRIRREPNDLPIDQRVSPKANVQRLVAKAIEGIVNGRFGEPVYFHPDEFAKALGLDRIALTRAIRTLAAETPVDYIPPFRGNALRLFDRQKKARDLKIDFTALHKRKNQEYEKLERIINYAATKACRRAFILSYFGDENAANCGRCDHCESRGGAASSFLAIDTPSGREVLQKILSGVARCKARFGKTVIAQMLCGSSSEKMSATGLRNLSTFGILAGCGFQQTDVVAILDALMRAGMVAAEDVDRFRPVMKITDRGLNWVKDANSPALVLGLDDALIEAIRRGARNGVERIAPPPPSASKAPQEVSGPGNDDRLRNRLKAMRLEWARTSGVKPDLVFTDQVLEDLLAARPTTPQEFSAILGVGPATRERYGEALLEAIHLDGPVKRPTIEPPRREDPAATPPPAPLTPTEEWTAKLLDRGFTIQDASAIRGLELRVILRHAANLASHGRSIPVEAFLPADVAKRWVSWFKERGSESTPPGDEGLEGFWKLFVVIMAVREG